MLSSHGLSRTDPTLSMKTEATWCSYAVGAAAIRTSIDRLSTTLSPDEQAKAAIVKALCCPVEAFTDQSAGARDAELPRSALLDVVLIAHAARGGPRPAVGHPVAMRRVREGSFVGVKCQADHPTGETGLTMTCRSLEGEKEVAANTISSAPATETALLTVSRSSRSPCPLLIAVRVGGRPADLECIDGTVVERRMQAGRQPRPRVRDDAAEGSCSFRESGHAPPSRLLLCRLLAGREPPTPSGTVDDSIVWWNCAAALADGQLRRCGMLANAERSGAASDSLPASSLPTWAAALQLCEALRTGRVPTIRHLLPPERGCTPTTVISLDTPVADALSEADDSGQDVAVQEERGRLAEGLCKTLAVLNDVCGGTLLPTVSSPRDRTGPPRRVVVRCRRTGRVLVDSTEESVIRERYARVQDDAAGKPVVVKCCWACGRQNGESSDDAVRHCPAVGSCLIARFIQGQGAPPHLFAPSVSRSMQRGGTSAGGIEKLAKREITHPPAKTHVADANMPPVKLRGREGRPPRTKSRRDADTEYDEDYDDTATQTVVVLSKLSKDRRGKSAFDVLAQCVTEAYRTAVLEPEAGDGGTPQASFDQLGDAGQKTSEGELPTSATMIAIDVSDVTEAERRSLLQPCLDYLLAQFASCRIADAATVGRVVAGHQRDAVARSPPSQRAIIERAFAEFQKHVDAAVLAAELEGRKLR